MKVFIDGQILDGAEATIPVTDHGLLYGDGVFEGMRSWSGTVFALDRHLARLERGAKALHLPIPGGIESIHDAVVRTVAATGSGDRYIRLLVTRGSGALGVDPTQCESPRVICIVDQIALYSDEQRREGLSLVTSSYRRPSADVLDPQIKTLNYLNNVLAKGEAKRQRADEALMLNGRGQVAEASVANVFVYAGGALSTPPTTDGCLDGITRATVIESARELGIPVAERSFGRVDILGAEEAFLTGTGAGIIRISRLDGQPVGGSEPGPVTVRLTDAYRKARTEPPALMR